MQTETIVAQATPLGRGGIGIIRVSGPKVKEVAVSILGSVPKPRHADYRLFYDGTGQILDQGIALFFPKPHSFTGEDVLEFHGHGGPVLLDLLLQHILTHDSVRLAKPGEFSEQAFLNDKIDLTQAEAIADLINANSTQAVRSAMASLQGVFANKINQLVDGLIALRIYVEAAIDFPEEEIDFLSDGKVGNHLDLLLEQLSAVEEEARQGALLQEGMKVVIVGRPNAGKSSLLNALAGRERAIVTDIAGTTRDTLQEQIQIDGMPLHIIDTAGLRDTNDQIEQIGIQRAWDVITTADRVLFIVDSTTTPGLSPPNLWPEFIQKLPQNMPLTLIRNKADLSQEKIQIAEIETYPVITVSAKTGLGLPELRQHLKSCMGYTQNTEGRFLARRRHLEALTTAKQHLEAGYEQLHTYHAGELLAEELRLAQSALNQITGTFTSDDLLGKIFGSFCIGK